jgi:hypothetical protein
MMPTSRMRLPLTSAFRRFSDVVDIEVVKSRPEGWSSLGWRRIVDPRDCRILTPSEAHLLDYDPAELHSLILVVIGGTFSVSLYCPRQ